MSIYIFSRPVHSGKTSALLKWCDQQKNIGGVLMPDINGSRKILDLKTNTVFDIQCMNTSVSKSQLTSVGKFDFYTAGFEKANSIIIQALSKDNTWLIIDEAGKLELDGKGFHDSIVLAVNFYNNNNAAGNLLITVRDSLCNAVISFFKIKNYRVVSRLEELV